LAAVQQKSDEFQPGARILTFNYDTGERYLSVEGLFWIQENITFAEHLTAGLV